MEQICKLLNIKQIFSTPYHHETIGALERNHRVLNEYMLLFAENNDWHKWVPFYMFAYNVTPHVDTRFTTYELIFGKFAYLLTDLINDNEPIHDIENYSNEMKKFHSKITVLVFSKCA